jgi:hypothetical protein
MSFARLVFPLAFVAAFALLGWRIAKWDAEHSMVEVVP